RGTQLIRKSAGQLLRRKRGRASAGYRGVVVVTVAVVVARLQGVLEDVVGDGSSGGFAEIVVEGPVDAHVNAADAVFVGGLGEAVVGAGDAGELVGGEGEVEAVGFVEVGEDAEGGRAEGAVA